MLKEDKEAAKSKEANRHAVESAKGAEQTKSVSSAKSNESGAVERILNNFVTSASAACYIGQNGLYQNGANSDKKKA